MFVYYSGANQHSISAGPQHRIVLNPGRNEVDDAVWQKIEESAKKLNEKAGINHLKEQGLIKIVEEDEAAPARVNIAGMTQKDAIDVIDAEVDEENLLAYLDQENEGKQRPKVLEAIDNRVSLLDDAGGPDDA